MKKTSMSKKVKRFLSAAISLSIIATNFVAMTAQAEGETSSSLFGNYPTHPTENNRLFFKDGKIDGVSATESNAEAAKRKFKIGEKEYLLVDKDDDGRYFILENQKTNGQKYYSGSDANVSSTDKDNWAFDYTNQNSIAYYLDNTYRNNMPSEIKKHLIKYDWDVEGDYPYIKNKQSELEATDWFKEKVKNNQPYTTSGYVSLMSATEYDAYKGIIGTADLNESDSTAWWGFMFRTPLTMLSGESVESATYNGYSPGYTHRFNDDKTPTDDINFALMPSLMNAVYYMRPCFWVDANFFADVKVTGYENSEIVKQELKEQGYAKLNRAGYTDEEILALGITEKNWYGRYPKHPSKNDSEYYYFGDTGVSAEASETAANERKFSVGEKEYLLLDKDESGNYFIIQNSNKDKVKAYYSGGSTQNDGKLDEWRYNYADEKSVAYYLDNEYRMTMPNGIKDHLIKYDWHVEGNWPRHQNVPNQWLKDTIANNQPEVQSGYLALMSATELHAYKDVIGVMGTETTNWQGIQLRTRYSLAYNDQRSPLAAEYFKNSAGNIEINDSGINLASPQYYLRPCFWVDANFFANVKVTGYENSSIVKQVLKEQGYAKLNNAGYTNDEITSIGVTDRSRYGLYPTHPTQNNKILFRDGAADVSANNSDAEAAKRLFSIGGKNYLLLDKDSDGKYFVIEDQKTNGQKYYNGGDANVSSTDKDNWAFDHKNRNSIAYYLDNGYKDAMPNGIKDHLVMYDWTVEGDYPLFNGKQSEFEATERFKEKVKNNQPYKTSGYVSLMSATEYDAYKNVIGTADLDADDSTGWWGFMFRTPLTMLSGESVESATYNGYSPGYKRDFKDGNPTNDIRYACMPSLINAVYYMRPCFWLEKDFFADVHVDNAGEFVTAEISENYDYLDLIGTYTDEEIRSMGIEVTERPQNTVPSISNLKINHTGNKIEAAYTYNNGLADEYNNRPHISSAFGDNSTFVWYICSSDGSNKKAIADATENTLTVTANESGKYICVEVTPANGLGDVGEKQSLVYFVPEGTNELKINGVRLKNQNNTEIFDIGDVQNATALTVSVDVENLTDVQKDITLILTVYDNDKKLIGIQRTDLNSVEGNNGTLTLTTPSLNIKGANAKSVKVMLWNNFDEVKPYTKAIEVR